MDKKAALIKTRVAWNAFKLLFDESSAAVVLAPELKPVLDGLKALVATATAVAPAITKAIADAGGLDPVPPMTPAEALRAKQLADQVAALMQSFEDETRFKLFAMTIERSSDGKVGVGQPTLQR